MAKKRRVKKKKIIRALFVIMIVLGLAVGGILVITNKDTKKENPATSNKKQEEKPKVEEKKLKIVNQDSNSRNIAVMYNNISTVWGYQAGLQDAYLVYEMLVEGGYTRLMAIYKDAKTERIGSVRSSRPYFLDFASL